MSRQIAMRHLKKSSVTSIWKVEGTQNIMWPDKTLQNIFGKDGPYYELIQAPTSQDAIDIFAAEHSLDPAFFQASYYRG